VNLPTVQQGGLVHSAAAAGPPLVAAAHRIMVVDDNADGAESLAMVLRMAGHQVLVITDAQQAEHAAITFGADAIVLDLAMPGLDGDELAQRLHAHPTLARTRLIAVTSHDHGADGVDRVGDGFVGHVSKPVDYGALLALLG
jgi:two-component system CheB/CheR fusion protein